MGAVVIVSLHNNLYCVRTTRSHLVDRERIRPVIAELL